MNGYYCREDKKDIELIKELKALRLKLKKLLNE
jgi:hypothetical protein